MGTSHLYAWQAHGKWKLKNILKEMTLKKTIDIVPMTNVWHFFAEYFILFIEKKLANFKIWKFSTIEGEICKLHLLLLGICNSFKQSFIFHKLGVWFSTILANYHFLFYF
jgi:hypothetical protein